MNQDRRLGKISRVEYGMGGYNDTMIGLTLTLSGDGWGVGSFIGNWLPVLEENHPEAYSTKCERAVKDLQTIASHLKAAGCLSVSELLNKPVEVTFESAVLIHWRILKEVL